MSRWLLVSGGAAISGAALAYLTVTMDVASAAEILRRVNVWPVLGALGVLSIELTLRARRWSVILPSDADGRSVPALRLVPILLIGYLGNAALPARLGEPIRAFLASRRERVGMAESLASVVLERIVDVATLAVVALGAALVIDPAPWATQFAAVAAAMGVAVLGVLMTFGIGPLVSAGRKMASVSASKTLGRSADHLERFASTLGGRKRRAAIQAAAGYSVLAWLLDGIIFFLIARSLGVELSYAGALLISGITVLSTAIPSAPGFVGTFEVAGVAGAAAVGVPADEGLALAVLAHVVTLGSLALGGAISLPILGADLREALLGRPGRHAPRGRALEQ